MANQHADWASKTQTEELAPYTVVLFHRLPLGAQVLKLSCGAGVARTQQLAKRFSVTGVDMSSEGIDLAKQNVQNAKCICGDMCQLSFPPASFEAAAAFGCIIRIPSEEQTPLPKSIATWLRPGGLLVATTGVGSVAGDVTEDWMRFGVRMYWSSFDAATNRGLIESAGFHIISAQEETEDEGGIPVTFLWIVAQKPERPVAPLTRIGRATGAQLFASRKEGDPLLQLEKEWCQSIRKTKVVERPSRLLRSISMKSTQRT